MPDGSVLLGRPGVSRTWGTTGGERPGGARERLLILGDPLLLFPAGCGPIPFSSSLPFLFSSPKHNFVCSQLQPSSARVIVRTAAPQRPLFNSKVSFPKSHSTTRSDLQPGWGSGLISPTRLQTGCSGPSVRGRDKFVYVNLAPYCFCNLLILFTRQVQSLC